MCMKNDSAARLMLSVLEEGGVEHLVCCTNEYLNSGGVNIYVPRLPIFLLWRCLQGSRSGRGPFCCEPRMWPPGTPSRLKSPRHRPDTSWLSLQHWNGRLWADCGLAACRAEYWPLPAHLPAHHDINVDIHFTMHNGIGAGGAESFAGVFAHCTSLAHLDLRLLW